MEDEAGKYPRSQRMWQSRQPPFSLLTLEIFPRWKEREKKKKKKKKKGVFFKILFFF